MNENGEGEKKTDHRAWCYYSMIGRLWLKKGERWFLFVIIAQQSFWHFLSFLFFCVHIYLKGTLFLQKKLFPKFLANNSRFFIVISPSTLKNNDDSILAEFQIKKENPFIAIKKHFIFDKNFHSLCKRITWKLTEKNFLNSIRRFLSLFYFFLMIMKSLTQ